MNLPSTIIKVDNDMPKSVRELNNIIAFKTFPLTQLCILIFKSKTHSKLFSGPFANSQVKAQRYGVNEMVYMLHVYIFIMWKVLLHEKKVQFLEKFIIFTPTLEHLRWHAPLFIIVYVLF